MRYFGNKNAVPTIPVPADSVGVFLLAANTPQAMDYPATADVARIAFASTAGGALAGVFNGNSTGALWGTSQSATVASSGSQALVTAGESVLYQRTRGSTCFSVVTPTSGVCHVEFWTKGGGST